MNNIDSWLERNQGLGIWLTALATVVLAVGVVFAWFAVRDARRTRHGQLIVDLSRRWDELAFAEQLLTRTSRARLLEFVNQLYGVDPAEYGPDQFLRLSELPSLVETIAVLVRQQSLTVEIVNDLWGPTISEIWSVWESAIVTMRELTGAFDTYSNFEWLAARLARARS